MPAHMVVRATDAALQISEVSFNDIRRDTNTLFVTDVLGRAMVYLIVLTFALGALQHCARHDSRGPIHHLLNDRLQVSTCHPLNVRPI